MCFFEVDTELVTQDKIVEGRNTVIGVYVNSVIVYFGLVFAVYGNIKIFFGSQVFAEKVFYKSLAGVLGVFGFDKNKLSIGLVVDTDLKRLRSECKGN